MKKCGKHNWRNVVGNPNSFWALKWCSYCGTLRKRKLIRASKIKNKDGSTSQELSTWRYAYYKVAD